MNASLTDTLVRLGFSAEPSHRYGLHCLYDAGGHLVCTFAPDDCWQYLQQHGLIGDAA